MPTCRKGHFSGDPAVCEVCGTDFNEPPPPVREPEPEPAPEWDCPNGHPGQTGQFCEDCGYDTQLPPDAPEQTRTAPSSASWTAVVSADREYYDLIRAEAGELEVDFPRFLPPRRFDLRGESMLIGRADPARGIAPEIDLGGPPEDRAIGRAHAMLVAQEDGSWAVVDLGSVNRTQVNDRTTAIKPNQPVVLGDGDRIYLGAWTVITIRSSRT
ncbi:FHA domain-containing protein [Amycolatopsis nigrescens]|uniref:FHA domain-containing protein n=1 Tax=Amycolatopsis nigrescens TaxID=381445 RepID=UPI000476DCD7|nr:FHA domain-containing protein [Amycolatopsis nigrescens]